MRSPLRVRNWSVFSGRPQHQPGRQAARQAARVVVVKRPSSHSLTPRYKSDSSPLLILPSPPHASTHTVSRRHSADPSGAKLKMNPHSPPPRSSRSECNLLCTHERGAAAAGRGGREREGEGDAIVYDGYTAAAATPFANRRHRDFTPRPTWKKYTRRRGTTIRIQWHFRLRLRLRIR